MKIGKNNIIEGPLLKTFIKYFLPIFLGSLIQQSYQVVDAIIIGRFVGAQGLAAIDATYNYTRLMVGVFISVSLGGTIIIAQYYGSKQMDKVKTIIHNLVTMSLVAGLMITLMAILLGETFTRLMNVPGDIFDLSVSYLKLYFLGAMPLFLMNIFSGSLRAIGDSKTPFYYLLASSLLNILLDLLFVAYFKWGVEGAAIATVSAQVLVAGMFVGHMFNRTDSSKLSIKALGLQIKTLKEILKIGLPMGGQTILFVIANMSMQAAINTFGTRSIAAWAVVGKLDFVIWLFVDAIGMTVTTFVAQNYGAGHQTRMKTSSAYGLMLGMGIVGVISMVLYFQSSFLTSLFTNDGGVITNVKTIMYLIAPAYVLCAYNGVVAGIFKGKGDTLRPMIFTLITACFFRLVWVNAFDHDSVMDVLKAYPISWGLSSFFLSSAYLIKSYHSKMVKTR